jgi:hypothetical protein
MIREYGVEMIREGEEEDIITILLQLVTSLRYEKDILTNKLTNFLLEKSKSSEKISHNLFWYVNVEIDNPKYSILYKLFQEKFLANLKENNFKIYSNLMKSEKFFNLLYKECVDIRKNSNDRYFFFLIINKEKQLKKI